MKGVRSQQLGPIDGRRQRRRELRESEGESPMPMTYQTTYGPLLDLDTLPELRKNLARAFKYLFDANPTNESFGALVDVLFPTPPGPLASDPVYRLAWDLRTRLNTDRADVAQYPAVEFRGDW